MSYARNKSSYGGELRKSRAGRQGARPVSITHSMHVVLRASPKAGAAPFAPQASENRVRKIARRFAAKNNVVVHRLAVNRNHLHFYARFPSVRAYQRFIRALAGTIAKALGRRFTRFWHYRPFSRVVKGERGEKFVDNYIRVNEWESKGFPRHIARFMAAMSRRRP